MAASPFALATPEGIELLEGLVREVVAERAKFPTEEQLTVVGIDDKAVVLNYLAARRFHAACPRVDPEMEEERIWSRLRFFWKIGRT
ncbi:MAG TPA: hypothetical protein VI794_03115 [Patescibacteria group bacterium]|nr:hypothetical protein [Patescibacteria group bacterium]